ncbi:MAG: DUF1801 domain-containing protein [Chitinophagales bacterium]|nr:DUF1801 domain-containing protein [Chitinophagaceae bacterium]MCB9064991.1 DUF1801 domain-containing protein [Chitinophagales bacterium]
MNKFQNVSFKSIEEFLEYLPEDELKIVQKLRKLILSCMPEGKEKLAYNVPFYYQHKRVCYIWPASVPWGKIKETGKVEFGFCKGHKLMDEAGVLNKAGRKEIATIVFRSTKEIDTDLLRSYMYEALFIDEQDAK